MYSYHDWLLARELLLLMTFALFVVCAVLAGAWRSRKDKRVATDLIDQNEQGPAARDTLRNGFVLSERPHEGLRREGAPAAVERRAA